MDRSSCEFSTSTDSGPSNKSEDAWVWTTEQGIELFFDRNEIVRFRVESEKWTDLSPEKQLAPGEEEDDELWRRKPYQIEASMQQAGLGPMLWWVGDEE